MGKKRRERIRVPTPDVLWRVFRKRARSLWGTIGSPSLLRRGDPVAYRNLLFRCFVVVSGESVPLPSPVSLWQQQEIVTRTIEMMIFYQSQSSNVLCSGYDKCTQSSPLMEILTGPEWCLLLERVGEKVMIFLLKHTSIFLPLTHKKYHQVSGPPSSELCFKRTETGKKRGRENHGGQLSKRRRRTSPSEIDGTLSTVTCIRDSEVGDSLRPLVCDQDSEELSQILDMEITNQMTKNMMLTSETIDFQESQKTSDECAIKVRKRQRPCSSQRRRIRKELDRQKMESEASFQTKREVTRYVAKEAQVNRKMFYNLEVSSSALPRAHILNSLRPNTVGVMFLLKSIFGIFEEMGSPDTVLCSQYGHSLSDSDSDSDSVCLYHSLIKLLKNLIRRAQRCQHSRLLNKHCAVRTQDHNAVSELKSQEENSELQHGTSLKGSDCEDIKSYSQKSQVVSFVWAACRSIIPSSLLGTKKNWRVLTRNISKFVQLRRFEQFSLKQCMHRLKTSEFPLFANKRSLCCLSNQGKSSAGLNEVSPEMKQRIVESWVYWVFSFIVVPLLQANFYVTDCEHGRQEVIYYTKSVWEKVKKRAIAAMKDKNYVHLDDATAWDIVKRRKFGFSKVRLLPKQNGLRLLANLKSPSKMRRPDSYRRRELVGAHGRRGRLKKTCDSCHFKSVNYVLREAHAILEGMQLKMPEKLGSSVFDYNDVYRKLCPFLIGLKRSFSEVPALFLIASDVSKAYDSVCQDKLLSVLNDVLRHDKYTLKQFSEVCSTDRSVWVRENLALLDENINSRFLSAISCRSTDSILVDKECRKVVKKEELLLNLYEHIKSNVMQLHKKLYLQRVGICQGSVLSSLLCSLYYGDMDNKVIFPFLERVNKPGSKSCTSNIASQLAPGSQITDSYLLLRFTDDFLFISTSRKQAESFFSRLSRGFRDYNCYMNKDKYTVNFDVSHVAEAPSNRLCVGKDDVSYIRWSGLLINCTTLEVHADYTKYFNNHLSSTLTVSWQGKPGRQLKQKLCRFMRPKCHPLFYDPNINSPGIVRLNIFQSFLLSAMKFHCYLRDLSYICKFPARSYLRTIENSFSYMHFLIKRRMRTPSLGLDENPFQHLGEREVEWLGLNAFIQVLTRKQSRHKRLVLLLKRKLSVHDSSWKRSSELDYAVDVSNSTLVWKIKY